MTLFFSDIFCDSTDSFDAPSLVEGTSTFLTTKASGSIFTFSELGMEKS